MNHRDHVGGTVLHAAVAGSADEDCVLLLSRKGGVRLIPAVSWAVGSREPTTVVSYCLSHRMYLMVGLLYLTALQYKMLGRVVCLKSVYGLLYWILSLLTLPLLLLMTYGLLDPTADTNSSSSSSSMYILHGLLALCSWIITQVLWMATFLTDPGIVPGSTNRIRDQFASVDP